MKHFLLLTLFASSFACITACQDDDLNEQVITQPKPGDFNKYNANTVANVYKDDFLYGSNMGYITNWTDQDLADVLTGNKAKGIEGIGVNSLRPALYNYFVEQYGYDVRIDAFKHYTNNGSKLNTVFIGDRPYKDHEEPYDENGNRIAPYKNLYEPIWDNGENDTPVNDENYYALYVYKVALKYGPHVRFWEIMNEPDYVTNGTGDKGPGENDNWWDNDPNPAYLSNLKAPVQSYIRMLRISYEVIKTLYPESFICVGGLGYVSFLDAILRNTDNPDGGKVTDEYPLNGGAWFDCVSYHIYPMYYLRKWVGRDKPNHINGFYYYRHSDAAAQTVIDRKDVIFELLAKKGYDGSTFPLKEVIVTETNIPSKQFSDYIGSPESQRNFAIKTAILSQINGVSGIHIFGPYDNKESHEEGTVFQFCGLYKPLGDRPGGELRLNESGMAWRTMTSLIGSLKYNPGETGKLNLPETISGAAFGSGSSCIYVLWAKTETDLSEAAEATYTFPESMKVTEINYKNWNNESSTVTGKTIKLTGDPVFIKINQKFN